jgi:hypothetical protein
MCNVYLGKFICNVYLGKFICNVYLGKFICTVYFGKFICNVYIVKRETIYYHFTISVHLKSSLIKGGGWLLVREVKPYKKETYTHWAWCNKIYSTYYWSLTCMATAIRTTFHVTTTIIVWGASFHTYTSISPYGRTFSWLGTENH